MATYSFRFPQIAYDVYTRTPAVWREDGKLYDEAGQLVPTTDMNGVPGPLRTGATGIIAPFKAEVDAGNAVFGDTSPTLVLSDDLVLLRDRVDELVGLAQQAANDANLALTKAVPVSYIGRDPDGRVWVSQTPVEVGGGIPVLESGRLYFLFPSTA